MALLLSGLLAAAEDPAKAEAKAKAKAKLAKSQAQATASDGAAEIACDGAPAKASTTTMHGRNAVTLRTAFLAGQRRTAAAEGSAASALMTLATALAAAAVRRLRLARTTTLPDTICSEIALGDTSRCDAYWLRKVGASKASIPTPSAMVVCTM